MAQTTNTNKKKVEDYGSFDYSDYVESDSVKQAKDNLNSLQKPGAYQSQWQQSLNDAINKIQNREKFSYDLNGDALYQQYKDQYVLGGQMAMQDTIGQASALTGGYGNSYAQGVGQQAYQGYLQKLNDKVPELYQLALDQYNREGDDLYSQYALMADRENTDYGRYRDTMSDYNTERGYLTDQYNAERDYDYSKYSDDRNFNYGVFSDDRNLQYQVDRDAVADSQWQQTYDEGVRQFDVQQGNWEKEFAFTTDSWEQEFEQRVSEFDQEYQLKVRQIEEDERNGKISREVAQREIQLAEDKFKADKEQAAAELEYKYAALEASKDGNKGEDEDGNLEDYANNYNDMYDAGVEWLKSMGLTSNETAKLRTRSEWARNKPYGATYEDYIEEFLNKTLLERNQGPVKGTASGGNKFLSFVLN